MGFLNEGGLGESVRVAARWECKLANAIELTESVLAAVAWLGAKLEGCWLITGDTK